MGWVPLDDDEKYPSLGYVIADWMEDYLLRPDCDDTEPFVCTQEQLEFLVEFYRLDPSTGERYYQRGVLCRPRGWGKSPFLAAIAIAEAIGPVRFGGWDEDGQPIGVPWREFLTPLVNICATTDGQTANTWDPLLEMLRGSRAEREYGLDVMETFVSCNPGLIERRTSSATSVKGRRAVFAVMDQTETWLPGNGGVRFAQTLRNNASKLNGTTLESPNAFVEGANSVAEDSWKSAELQTKGKVKEKASKIFYDHRSAPLETDPANWKSLVHGLRVAYGDSSAHAGGCVIHEPPCEPGWVNIERIAGDFWDPANDPAEMAADFLNQIGSASNAWLSAPELRAIVNTDKVISKDEPITLGFDGSEGRKIGIADSTVLIGYSVEQRHFFQLGIWSQPDGPAGEGWQPPKLEIEQKIREVFDQYNVVGFYADPSAGWAGDVKHWESRYGRRLKAKISANEPIRYPQRNVSLTCETFAELLSQIRQQTVTYDGSSQMTAHFLNARKDPRRAGYVLVKPAHDQDYSKIDATWGAMFAFRAGLDALGKGFSTTRRRRAPRRLY